MNQVDGAAPSPSQPDNLDDAQNRTGRIIVIGLLIFSVTLGCSSLFLRAYVREVRGLSTTESVLKKLSAKVTLAKADPRFAANSYPKEASETAKKLAQQIATVDLKNAQWTSELSQALAQARPKMKSDIRDRLAVTAALDQLVTRVGENPKAILQLFDDKNVAQELSKREAGDGFKQVWNQELANGLGYFRYHMTLVEEQSFPGQATLTNAQTADMMATYARILATAIHSTDQPYVKARMALLKGKQISDYQTHRVVNESLIIFPQAVKAYDSEYRLRSRLAMLRTLYQKFLQSHRQRIRPFPETLDMSETVDPLSGKPFEYAGLTGDGAKIWSTYSSAINVTLKP